jgi:hypothetical protein
MVAINNWNRIAIGFRAEPGTYHPAKRTPPPESVEPQPRTVQ